MALLNKNGTQCRLAASLVLRCTLFCAQATSLLAQNLVPNPSFELIDTCPQSPYLLGYQPGAVPQYWCSSSDTPDYFNACVDTVSDVPYNVFTYQPAFDGNAYSGMWSYLPGDHREMIGVELTGPLVAGQTYYASFYANAAYGGSQQPGMASNNLGVLFRMDPYYWVISGQPEFGLGNFGHVRAIQVIGDTANWVLVSGSFVADSAYRYMVVGIHYTDENTLVDSLGPGVPWAYQLVDQFCVSMDPQGCPMANEVVEQTADGVVIFPNPARDFVQITWKGLEVDRLRVTDPLGRSVQEQSVVGLHGSQLNTAAWSRGAYTITVEGEGMHRSFKFVLVE